ncbi:ribbon-helix-helix domain-containing protein [Nocardioides cheoyonin]|uniref:ribbon-helix-helix domain-containing protein n=1 Tax=Nocardioides cheoyonin TaxID=3156615 RepID=UPI0032B57F8D
MAAQRIEFSQHEIELIDKLVRDGVYADATEAVHEGLRLLERERRTQAEKLETLRSEVQKGFDDLDEGHYTEINSDEELDAFMDGLSARAAERVAARRQ